MFLSLGLPTWFNSRCEPTQSLIDKGQAEALHNGPAQSEENSGGPLGTDAFVVEKELNEDCKTILIATSVTNPKARTPRGEVRHVGNTRNQRNPVVMYKE